MKGKFANFALGFLVIVIWAWVMFNVYDYVDEDENLNALPVHKAMVSEQVVKEKETYILKLNYADPFLKKAIRNTDNIVGNASGDNQNKLFVKAETVKVIPEQKVVLPQYLGRISNKKGSVAIVLISNAEHMVQEGEQIENIKFVKILNDSIKVIIDKKVYYAKKSK